MKNKTENEQKRIKKSYKDYHTGASVNKKLIKLRDDWKVRGIITDEQYFERLKDL